MCYSTPMVDIRYYVDVGGDARVLAGLQAEQARTALRRVERQMAKSGSFKELVQTRVKKDKKFAEALLREGIDAMLSGDVETGKTILRDYIKATVGFEKLGEATGTQPKSSHPDVRSAR